MVQVGAQGYPGAAAVRHVVLAREVEGRLRQGRYEMRCYACYEWQPC